MYRYVFSIFFTFLINGVMQLFLSFNPAITRNKSFLLLYLLVGHHQQKIKQAHASRFVNFP